MGSGVQRIQGAQEDQGSRDREARRPLQAVGVTRRSEILNLYRSRKSTLLRNEPDLCLLNLRESHWDDGAQIVNEAD